MDQNKHYLDLLKAHKIFVEIEGRWKFYEAYMNNRNWASFMGSGNIPLREGLLLFGFVHSWDPNFQGDLAKFLEIYKEVFPMVKALENAKLEEVELTTEVKSSVGLIFDRIGNCPRERRFESTDTSKILHAILPSLFVMWDASIRKGIVGEKKGNGRTYASEFLPKMQESIKDYLRSYIEEKGGKVQDAVQEISSRALGYTLPKLIDEYNYVRYRKRKTLSEIRSVSL